MRILFLLTLYSTFILFVSCKISDPKERIKNKLTVSGEEVRIIPVFDDKFTIPEKENTIGFQAIIDAQSYDSTRIANGAKRSFQQILNEARKGGFLDPDNLKTALEVYIFEKNAKPAAKPVAVASLAPEGGGEAITEKTNSRDFQYSFIMLDN